MKNYSDMYKINNFFKAFFLLTFALSMSSVALSQLSKNELPKSVLVEKKDNTPRQIEFKGNKMIVTTDPNKNVGTQYMVEYKVVWNGNKFNLSSITEVSTTINDLGETIITTAKKADFFGYSYLKNWILKLDENGNYVLASLDNSDYEWIFIAK